MVKADASGEVDSLEKWATVGLIVRGISMSGLDLVINLNPDSPRRSKCSGVSDMLTNHCRAEPLVQHESIRLSPGHITDTDDDSKFTVKVMNRLIIITQQYV